jgi:hypothetical protein
MNMFHKGWMTQFLQKYLPWIMLGLLRASVSCGLFDATLEETRAPQEFPDVDIVYVGSQGLGFVNADGSNPVTMDFVVKEFGNKSAFWRPVVTADNHALIAKVVPRENYVFNAHLLVLWRSRELPVQCQQWGEQQMPLLSADQLHVFIRTEPGMALYALKDCGTAKAPVTVYENDFGILSPDLQHLVYTDRPGAMAADDRFIVVRDVTSRQERVVGVGDYPAWSRDSQSLAYTGKDGLYVVNVADGSEPRRVVPYTNPYPGHENNPAYEGAAYWRVPPEVSWSPDGKWLVYHRWTGTEYETGVEPAYNAIYKVNIESGQESKVIDKGMYPSWRWPVETP